MTYIYPATIQPEEDGRYSIWFDDLDGCATSGETLAESIVMARDAMGGWIDNMLALGHEIPQPSGANAISAEGGQIVTLVDVDLEVYRRENDQRSIKKTLSIPSWLNTRAERSGVNFSKVLQDALCSTLGVTRP